MSLGVVFLIALVLVLACRVWVPLLWLLVWSSLAAIILATAAIVVGVWRSFEKMATLVGRKA